MSKLSDEITIRGKKIKNRIVMAPLVCFSFKGDNDGMYGKQHVDHYTKRAKGGTGLIIIQATPIWGAAKKHGVWSHKQMKPLETIAQNCHSYGSTVMMQLHCQGDVKTNELSAQEIHSMQADCVAGAISAKESGFDGVEFHRVHGFTLCKYFDSIFNQRIDSYGGSLENRVRVLTEIIPQTRETVGENFILSVHMGGNIPYLAGAIEVAKTLEGAGIDLLHISSGMKEPANALPVDFKCSTVAYNGSEIKKNVNLPVIAVQGIFNAEQAKLLVENDYVDLVAVGRGMFVDENWAMKVLADEPVNQCNNCGDHWTKCLWLVDHTKCPARKKTQKE
jgi:NADPH2 dehydrogenase